MKISNAMLINLSKQIESGLEITAIATANHYLKPDCLLRKALVTKAQGKLRNLNKATLSILAGDSNDDETILTAIESNNQKFLAKAHKSIIPSRFSTGFNRFKIVRRKIPSRRNRLSRAPVAIPVILHKA
jgi:hypothetical protein